MQRQSASVIEPGPKQYAVRTLGVPSLSELIRAGQASAAKIRRATKEALLEWLAQGERLNIVKTHYQLRGSRFVDFARRIGIDRSSAFQLVRLHKYREELLSRCYNEQRAAESNGTAYEFPGWRSALESFEPTNASKVRHIWKHESDEYGTPQALFDFLDSLFCFDVDVCATPKTAKCKRFWTKADDALSKTWKPRKVHYMNPPYSEAGKWAAKAAGAAKNGAVVVGLFASRTASGWYEQYVLPSAHVVQLGGKAAFTNGDRELPWNSASGAPFSSMLVIWPKSAAKVLAPYCQRASVSWMRIPD